MDPKGMAALVAGGGSGLGEGVTESAGFESALTTLCDIHGPAKMVVNCVISTS